MKTDDALRQVRPSAFARSSSSTYDGTVLQRSSECSHILAYLSWDWLRTRRSSLGNRRSLPRRGPRTRTYPKTGFLWCSPTMTTSLFPRISHRAVLPTAGSAGSGIASSTRTNSRRYLPHSWPTRRVARLGPRRRTLRRILDLWPLVGSHIGRIAPLITC